MTLSLPMIATRLFNTPLMVHAGKARAIVDALGARVLGSEIDFEGPEAVSHIAADRPSILAGLIAASRATSAPETMGRLGDPLGRRYEANRESAIDRMDAIAIIPIEGSLIHKGKWVGASSGDTSYEGIQTRVRQAMADPSIKGVVFELDSFGGEVAGAFDTANLIRVLSEQKPTMAILTDFALSAGYLLASGAREIVMPPSGRAGSIGVITLHADYSAALEKKGVKVTVLGAGKFKGEGNPYEALSEQTAARIKSDLEQARELFAEAVAEGRGKRLDKAGALSTEADDFRGDDALRLGLVDAVAHSNEAFDAFVAEIQAASRQSYRSFSMITGVTGVTRAASGLLASDSPEVISIEDHQAALTKTAADAQAAGFTAGKAEGLKEGACAERTRISAIMTSEHAKGRENLANHFAYATDMQANAALEAMKAAPAAAPTPQAPQTLDAEMSGDVQVRVTADGGRQQNQMTESEKGAAIALSLLGKKKA